MSDPVKFLKVLLSDKKTLAPQVKSYLDWMRKNQLHYRNLHSTKGVAAAELWLRQYAAAQLMRPLSSGIRPVVEGLLAVASVPGGASSTTYVRGAVSPIGKEFPGVSGFIKETSELLVWFNQPLHKMEHRSGRVWPPHELQFGTRGVLGLEAIAVVKGKARNDGDAETVVLALILKGRPNSRMPLMEHTMIALNLSGGVSISAYNIAVVPGRSSLEASLGLCKTEDSICTSNGSGGEVDLMIGFPGSMQYIANNLVRLSEYLHGLSKAE
ncbi:MAG: hypothetical protein NT003_00870 [Candidatus Magasanikbacteria bacterium]|nr:hypothetical protein [Candidatus Magasanikbacteria bacterium]